MSLNHNDIDMLKTLVNLVGKVPTKESKNHFKKAIFHLQKCIEKGDKNEI